MAPSLLSCSAVLLWGTHTMEHRQERRTHRRLGIRLPIECVTASDGRHVVYRTVTRDISSGGVCFEAESDEFPVGTSFEVEFEVPPGDGHSPYPGRVRGTAKVARVERSGDGGSPPQFRIAAWFSKPLKLVF